MLIALHPARTVLVRRLVRGVASLMLLCAAVVAQAMVLPSFDEVRAAYQPSTAILLDRFGQPISEVSLAARTRRLEWTPLRTLAPPMKEMLLVAEDRRFFQHSGVDWRAFVAALWQNLWYDHKRGASTLSMQLAGLLDPALHPSREEGGRRTLVQKWDQTFAAQALETRWSKEQILEAYLNLVHYRGNLQGVAAASWGLFQKLPGELKRPEAAILAALLRAPNARPGLVERRACELLERVGARGECSGMRQALSRLDGTTLAPRWNGAPLLMRRLQLHSGDRLRSTLDPAWQAAALAAIAQATDPDNGSPDAALSITVLDGPDASVRAYAGPLVPDGGDALTVRHAAGAMLLPFSAGLAIERQSLTAATLLPPLHPADGGGVTGGSDWMSVRVALRADPRRLMTLPGGRSLFEFSQDSGRRAIDPDQARLDSLELGGLYLALFSGGRWVAPRWLSDSPRSLEHTLLRPEAAFIAADMLHSADRLSCERSFVARDDSGAWFVGALGLATVVLRVDGEADQEHVLRDAWRSIRASTPAVASCLLPMQDVPPSVVQQMVAFRPAVEAPRREWFVRGTELAVSSISPMAIRIVQPRQGAIVDGSRAAREPDYRTLFLASADLPELRWYLDGKLIGEGGRAWWRPLAGLYRLELRDVDGRQIDTIDFAARAPLH